VKNRPKNVGFKIGFRLIGKQKKSFLLSNKPKTARVVGGCWLINQQKQLFGLLLSQELV